MKTELDAKQYRAGRLNAETDWRFVEQVAKRQLDYTNITEIEALGDAMVSRMNWMMKTGFSDAYRLGYIIELGTLFNRGVKEITQDNQSQRVLKIRSS